MNTQYIDCTQAFTLLEGDICDSQKIEVMQQVRQAAVDASIASFTTLHEKAKLFVADVSSIASHYTGLAYTMKPMQLDAYAQEVLDNMDVLEDTPAHEIADQFVEACEEGVTYRTRDHDPRVFVDAIEVRQMVCESINELIRGQE